MTFSIMERWQAVFTILTQLEDQGMKVISIDLTATGDDVLVSYEDLARWLDGDVSGLVGKTLTAGTYWTLPVTVGPGGPVVRLIAIQRHPHVVDPETLYA
jgi:hypothetical protein